MEYNEYFVFDYTSVFILIQLIVVICITVFYRLKMRWPVLANCWFCNKNTRIRRENLDWWLCPSCQQYNGFSKNGDYTYEIPEQYQTKKKRMMYCRSPEHSYTANFPKNYLCVDCNKRQSIKLLELSNFEPTNENLYDLELKAFKEYLEKRYPLCGSCVSTVRSVLSKQALWLIRFKMLSFRHKSVKAITSYARRLETILRVVSTILALAVACNWDLGVGLPIGGSFIHICACCVSSRRRRNLDMLLIGLWCCLTVLVSIENSTNVPNVWLTAEHVVQYHMIVVCATVVVLVSVMPGSYENGLTGSVAFKKLKSRARRPSEFTCGNRSDDDNILNDTGSSIESSLDNGTNHELFSGEVKSHPAASKPKLCTTNNSNNGNNNSCPGFVSSSKSSSSDCHRLNDSLSVLSALSLSEEPSRYSAKVPPIFERRVYTVTSCDLFKRSGAGTSGKRYVLSPPKLRSVTQTSWVAGGYWQEGMMSAPPPTLSRSSSQSSGFGSAGSSNLTPSREPSVHEFDRCSVMSDATQSCYTPRPGATSHHATPLCSSPSPVPRAQSSRSSVYDLATTIGNHSQALDRRAFGAIAAEDRTRDVEPPAGDRNGPLPVCSSHMTIVTSPGWLCALLCGSVILNMIVLCAMLLR